MALFHTSHKIVIQYIKFNICKIILELYAESTLASGNKVCNILYRAYKTSKNTLKSNTMYNLQLDKFRNTPSLLKLSQPYSEVHLTETLN